MVDRKAVDPVPPPYAPTLPAMLSHVANVYGEQEAVICAGRRLTFRELDRRSAQLARGLLARGVGKGTRVALLMPNSPEFVVFFMAAARIGAIVAPLSTLYQAPELAWVLKHADIDVLVTCDRYLSHDYLARLEQAFPQLATQTSGRLVLAGAPYLRTILVCGDCDRAWGDAAEPSLCALAENRPEIDHEFLAAVEASVVPADPLCMIYTSGSTAHPKGVVHSHGRMIRYTFRLAHGFWGSGQGDRIITTRPWFWIAGLAFTLFFTLHTGCCLIVGEDASGATVKKLIETEGANALAGDDAWFRTLASDSTLQAAGYEVYRVSMDSAAIARRSAEGVRYLNSTPAGRQDPPVRVPDERFARTYGMTETLGGHTMLPAGELLPPDRPGYCGRAAPGVIHKIVDPNTGEPVAEGQPGELLVGGECLMMGLYKVERDDTFTPQGLYATGDLCVVDDRGYLAFSARLGEMIKVRGANVSPLEVELCLDGLPSIERSTVLGLELGERDTLLVAAVQMRSGQALDEDAIRKELRGRISSFKVPKRLFALTAEEFPVTGSGKVKKAALKELLRARLGSALSPSGTA